MAELLLRVSVRVPPGAERADAVEKFQIGDLVDHVADGSAWSERELTNPDWRLVRVPLSNAALLALTEGEAERDPDEKRENHWRRICCFDLEADTGLAGWAEFIADDTRAVPMFVTDNAAALEAIIIERQPADDFVASGRRGRRKWSRR